MGRRRPRPVGLWWTALTLPLLWFANPGVASNAQADSANTCPAEAELVYSVRAADQAHLLTLSPQDQLSLAWLTRNGETAELYTPWASFAPLSIYIASSASVTLCASTPWPYSITPLSDQTPSFEPLNQAHLDASQHRTLEAYRQYTLAAEQLREQQLPEIADWALWFAAAAAVNSLDHDRAGEALAGINPLSPRSTVLKTVLASRLSEQPIAERLQALENLEPQLTKLGHRPLSASVYLQRAELELQQSATEPAAQLIKRALNLAGDNTKLASSASSLSAWRELIIARRTSVLEERRAHLQTALGLERQAYLLSADSPEQHLQTVYLNNIAFISAMLGDLHTAIAAYRNSLALARHNRTDLGYVATLGNIGRLYLSMGELGAATPYLTQALKTPIPTTSASSREQCNFGLLERAKGELQAAIETLTPCTAEPNLLRNRLEAGTEIALALYQSGRLEEARQQLREMQRIYLAALTGSRPLSDLIYTGSKLWIASSEILQTPEEQARTLSQLIELLPWQTDPAIRVDTLTALARLSDAPQHSATALAYLNQAVAEIESAHTALAGQRLGPAWSDRTHATFELLMTLQRRQAPADHSGLLQLAERGRAISLRQQLDFMLQRPESTSATEHLLAVAELADQRALQDSQVLAYAHYAAEDLHWGATSATSPHPVPPALEISALQSRMPGDQLISYFVVFKQQVLRIDLTRQTTTVTAIELLPEQRLADKLAQTVAALRAGRIPDAESVAALRQLLPDTSGFRSLVIVPHHYLNNVPWGLLAAASGTAIDLTLTPSLSVFAAHSAATDEPSLDLAIVADPDFTASPVRFSSTLPRLQWSAQEAAYLQGEIANTRSFLGQAANRYNLFSTAARQASILHIATHGYYAANSAQNVGLLLSGGATTATPAFVTLTELSAYPFHNQLVVVSGCDTASGESRQGEGNTSIGRAFLAQGAHRVIATLWPVDDRGSAAFMREFYQHLTATGNVANALQQAQTALRRSRHFRHPKFWAPYVLYSATQSPTIKFSGSRAGLSGR